MKPQGVQMALVQLEYNMIESPPSQFNRPSLNKCFMEFAQILSQRSSCVRLSVGVIIASDDYERIYAIGYNGGAKGQNNNCESNEPGKCGHLHAEINALIKCSTIDKNKIMFVTHYPCKMCAKAIVNSGFKEIFYKNDYRDDGASKIFEDANIEITQL